MKKLFILLLSTLVSFSSLSDDISEFEIEGISIGDSLLEYMSQGDILKGIERNKNDYPYLSEPLKYFEVYLFDEFSIFDEKFNIFSVKCIPTFCVISLVSRF